MSAIDYTAVLRHVEWIPAADYSPDYCPVCDVERADGHAPDCALAAAIAADPTAEIARLRAEVEQAHAALDRAGVDRSDARTLSLSSRIVLLDAAGRSVRESIADRRAMREAHAEALAEVERLTRERDAALRKASEYERDWYDSKAEFGTAMGRARGKLAAAIADAAKLREVLRELVRVAESEKHDLADLDEAAWQICARADDLGIVPVDDVEQKP